MVLHHTMRTEEGLKQLNGIQQTWYICRYCGKFSRAPFEGICQGPSKDPLPNGTYVFTKDENGLRQ